MSKLFFPLKVFLLVVCLVAVKKFCHKQTKGFTTAKISSSLPFNPDWEIQPISNEDQKELDHILDQPFYFFGSGGQCYAFLGEDENTVIKFFKHHHMTAFPILKKIYLPSYLDRLRTQFLQNQERKLDHLFGSCKLAYNHFKTESGLIYLHLNKTTHFNKKLKIIDKLGIVNSLDVDSTTFILQKKADLAFERIAKSINQGDAEGAKQLITSLMESIVIRCKKGIKDTDTGLKRNFGFLGNTAVAIDIGSLEKDETLKNPSKYKKELAAKTARLNRWLKKHFPEYWDFYQEQLQLISNQEE